MDRVLITGGLGQIGSLLAEKLIENGVTVVVIDNLSTGRLEHLETNERLEILIGDIASPALITSIAKQYDFDAVVHCAASYKDPDDWFSDISTNCLGGVNLIKLCSEMKARMIYLQTALCYEPENLDIPLLEGLPRAGKKSSYALSKTLFEHYLELSELDYVTFRLANVVGARNLAGPLPIFYKRLTEGRPCVVTKSSRDFVWNEDLVHVMLQALAGKGKGAYNFSSSSEIEVKTLFEEVVKTLRVNKPEVTFIDPPQDDVGRILLDNTKLRADFDVRPFASLETIVGSAIEYFRSHGVDTENTHLKLNKKV